MRMKSIRGDVSTSLRSAQHDRYYTMYKLNFSTYLYLMSTLNPTKVVSRPYFLPTSSLL